MANERRRWRRLQTELRLQLHVTLADSGGRVMSAVGSHMNPSGIFVHLADPPPLGAHVRITLEAEGTDGVLTADGVVVDRAVPDDGSDRRPGIGIRLEQKGPAWAKLYEWFMNEAE